MMMRCSIARALTLAFALVCFSALLVVPPGAEAQECLPGQSPCLETCCDTNASFTCCPYNGGYCAPPGDQCCENAPKGLCSKEQKCCLDSFCCDGNSTCCASKQCAPPGSRCCGIFVCKDGTCCQSELKIDGFCLSSGTQCCHSGNSSLSSILPAVYACPEDDDGVCCSHLTSRKCKGALAQGYTQDALNGCCKSGTVCCPPAKEINPMAAAMLERKLALVSPAQRGDSYSSTACGNFDADPAKATLLPPPPPPPRASQLQGNVTPCADPQSQFCCGGMACPTETLCCEGSDNTYGDGCCFGIPSKTYSCEDAQNARCPSPDTIRF